MQVPQRDAAETPIELADHRQLRADAQRNRRRILEAAEEVFGRDGISAPVDLVAERAGVGVGTLYRHFPTKEALFEAIVLDKLDDLIAAADADVEKGDATEAFFDFLLRMAEEVTLKHDLFDALAAAGIDFKSRCVDRAQYLKQSLDRLRQRAVDAGGVRDDVTMEQVMGLVMGACSFERSGVSDDVARRLVGVVCDGLRTGRSTHQSSNGA